jgi:hypothetical protein
MIAQGQTTALNNDFVEVDEAMFRGIENPRQLSLGILGIGKFD